jgi:hypothetical protein
MSANVSDENAICLAPQISRQMPMTSVFIRAGPILFASAVSGDTPFAFCVDIYEYLFLIWLWEATIGK